MGYCLGLKRYIARVRSGGSVCDYSVLPGPPQQCLIPDVCSRSSNRIPVRIMARECFLIMHKLDNMTGQHD